MGSKRILGVGHGLFERELIFGSDEQHESALAAGELLAIHELNSAFNGLAINERAIGALQVRQPYGPIAMNR